MVRVTGLVSKHKKIKVFEKKKMTDDRYKKQLRVKMSKIPSFIEKNGKIRFPFRKNQKICKSFSQKNY